MNRYIITVKKDEPHGETREIEVEAESIVDAEWETLADVGPDWTWWGSRLDKANV